MATDDNQIETLYADPNFESVVRGNPSAFEKLITDQPPILQSLIAQLPTQSILALYHTSFYLSNFLKNSPTSWRYISWRLYQPALTIATPTNNSTGTGPRQSSNYALDKLLIHVINPFSKRLVSLELDNTAVSGSTLFQTVMVLRKDTLEHVSVRGCKNVSLKYHINPWLAMHAMSLDEPINSRAPGYERLALKSLYTYRCRHHRRRPYLPSSLVRKESDSEPTHELVLTCQKLGIWTDTAWCPTPGGRCFRRKGYVTMRIPQDPREVWVVYDRLWRSRNWLGPVPENRAQTTPAIPKRKRKQDCRSWEFDEDAMNGESIAAKGDGKAVPTHLRKTHRQFVEDIYCDNCSEYIYERCEQCSIIMHCSGCRKTLCASCAFDRPYLRNKGALEEDRNRFWWAPGAAVTPNSMQDFDPSPPGPVGNNSHSQSNGNAPTIKFRWCCTEPVFSGGGGITFGNPPNAPSSQTIFSRDSDRVRAAPLPPGHGWEDPEFSHHTCSELTNSESLGQIGVPLTRTNAVNGPGGRWPSIDSLFHADPSLNSDQFPAGVPRVLCDDCYHSDQWKIKCKACSVALCLKHDVQDRLRVRICGYKDLVVERAEYQSRQTALKLLTMLMLKRRKTKMKALEKLQKSASTGDIVETKSTSLEDAGLETEENGLQTPRPTRSLVPNIVDPAELNAIRRRLSTPIPEGDRPISPGSNSTGPPSRTSSPSPSTRSLPATPEPKNSPRKANHSDAERPIWRGCQSFFCPPSRLPGDHRRRCVAVLRQCAECRIYVCEQCTASLEPPCPCKGCRVPSEDGQTDLSSEPMLRFFCPNCRWSRMEAKKCKRKPVSASGKGSLRKGKKNRPKKPFSERQGHRNSNNSSLTEGAPQDAADALLEFFEGLQEIDERELTAALPTSNTNPQTPPPGEEISELEDMGALARDLIRRIQTLRQQFGPNSVAAQALPDIRMNDAHGIQTRAQVHPMIPIQVLQRTEVADNQRQDDDPQESSSGSGA